MYYYFMVFEYVGDVGWCVQIIFQYVVLIVVIVYYIDVGDMGIGIVWQVDVLYVWLILFVG